MIRNLALCLAIAGLPIFAAPAHAETPVDLELVLAVDSSASVDRTEFTLQLQGLADAFRDPEVLQAIRSGPLRAIAVTLVEWASASRQEINVPWRLVDGPSAAEALAIDIETAPRLIETGSTSISAAIRFGLGLFEGNGFAGERMTIDISGDGHNNAGPLLEESRQLADGLDVTVNGLAIENEAADLGDYFSDSVIVGPGSFAMRANDYGDYIQAIRRKLIREIRSVPVASKPPCSAASVLELCEDGGEIVAEPVGDIAALLDQ